MEKILIGALAGGVIIYGAYYLLKKNNSSKSNFKNYFDTLEYDVLRFSDVLEQSKRMTKDYGISENRKLVLLKVDNDYIITFYDQVTNEIIESKTILLKCKEIDESLRLAFDDKTMIVIEE